MIFGNKSQHNLQNKEEHVPFLQKIALKITSKIFLLFHDGCMMKKNYHIIQLKSQSSIRRGAAPFLALKEPAK